MQVLHGARGAEPAAERAREPQRADRLERDGARPRVGVDDRACGGAGGRPVGLGRSSMSACIYIYIYIYARRTERASERASEGPREPARQRGSEGARERERSTDVWTYKLVRIYINQPVRLSVCLSIYLSLMPAACAGRRILSARDAKYPSIGSANAAAAAGGGSGKAAPALCIRATHERRCTIPKPVP